MSRLVTPVRPGDNVLGSPDAPVKLVEYGDYECLCSARADAVIAEILRLLPNEVIYVFRHFPMAQVHPHALLAAQAAEAAGEQGAYWPMHETLFANRDSLGVEDLIGYAEGLELDVTRFAQEIDDEMHLPKVRADLESGIRSGVSATPTFFIDDARHDGPWASLLAGIETRLSVGREARV